jgi:hypothetical protein
MLDDGWLIVCESVFFSGYQPIQVQLRIEFLLAMKKIILATELKNLDCYRADIFQLDK